MTIYALISTERRPFITICNRYKGSEDLFYSQLVINMTANKEQENNTEPVMSFSIVDVMTLIAKFVFPKVWAEYCPFVLFLWKCTSVDSLSRWDFVVRLSVAQSAEDWPQGTIIGSAYISLWAFASYLLFSFINLLYSHSHNVPLVSRVISDWIYLAQLFVPDYPELHLCIAELFWETKHWVPWNLHVMQLSAYHNLLFCLMPLMISWSHWRPKARGHSSPLIEMYLTTRVKENWMNGNMFLSRPFQYWRR